MRFSMFACVLWTLAACSSPGYEYRGIKPKSVVVDGSEFDVYVDGENVRVIRTNFETLPKLSVIAARAITAIELVSQCTVDKNSLQGDQAMIDVTIFC